MKNTTSFSQKFKIKNLTIQETDYWIWSLRPFQATLGASILSLKRPCSRFSDLKIDEYKDLGIIVKKIESTLLNIFKFDVMNYLILMMFDKQVHFHVLPRYEKTVEVFGKIWNDDDWPAVPTLIGEELAYKDQMKLLELIKSNLDLESR